MAKILLSIYPEYTKAIFSEIKTAEFRRKVVNELLEGGNHTLYFYETKKNGGAGKVVGQADVKEIFVTLQAARDDAVSLSTLYHLRGNMQELLSSKVWLDSGANIIIESLETLTVIDVNSGKNRSRREEALFAINVEAAKEIARQLRLRNISGMILVDFINLKKKEQQQKLISVIREELQKDSVPANFIDITRLGLVELTRKKVYKSLREILS